MEMDHDKIYKTYRVCNAHFSEASQIGMQYIGKSRLKQGALPTLHLPNIQENMSCLYTLGSASVEDQRLEEPGSSSLEPSTHSQKTVSTPPRTPPRTPLRTPPRTPQRNTISKTCKF